MQKLNLYAVASVFSITIFALLVQRAVVFISGLYV